MQDLAGKLWLNGKLDLRAKQAYIRDIAICQQNMATKRVKESKRQRLIDRE